MQPQKTTGSHPKNMQGLWNAKSLKHSPKITLMKKKKKANARTSGTTKEGKTYEAFKMNTQIMERVRQNKDRTGVSIVRFIEDAVIEKLEQNPITSRNKK